MLNVFNYKNSINSYYAEKGLTPAERRVCLHTLDGSINKDIAKKLGVKEKTIKFHLTNVFKKLNISRRTQLFWTLPLDLKMNEDHDPNKKAEEKPAEEPKEAGKQETKLPVGWQ